MILSTTSKTPHFLSKSGGFSMIEVLITLVILSIGLLGLAGLQAVGLRNNNTAYLRTIATQQLNDMADSMRTNRPGVLQGSYDAISGVPANPGCIESPSGCSPTLVAQYDHFAWNTKNQSLLPNGTGTVARCPLANFPLGCPAGSNRFVISVIWEEIPAGANNPNTNTTLSITVDL
jgi:type IV pilus assembly protein PilV